MKTVALTHKLFQKPVAPAALESNVIFLQKPALKPTPSIHSMYKGKQRELWVHFKMKMLRVEVV